MSSSDEEFFDADEDTPRSSNPSKLYRHEYDVISLHLSDVDSPNISGNEDDELFQLKKQEHKLLQKRKENAERLRREEEEIRRRLVDIDRLKSEEVHKKRAAEKLAKEKELQDLLRKQEAFLKEKEAESLALENESRRRKLAELREQIEMDRSPRGAVDAESLARETLESTDAKRSSLERSRSLSKPDDVVEDILTSSSALTPTNGVFSTTLASGASSDSVDSFPSQIMFTDRSPSPEPRLLSASVCMPVVSKEGSAPLSDSVTKDVKSLNQAAIENKEQDDMASNRLYTKRTSFDKSKIVQVCSISAVENPSETITTTTTYEGNEPVFSSNGTTDPPTSKKSTSKPDSLNLNSIIVTSKGFDSSTPKDTKSDTGKQPLSQNVQNLKVPSRPLSCPDPVGDTTPKAPPRKKRNSKRRGSSPKVMSSHGGLPPAVLTPHSTVQDLTKDLEQSLSLSGATAGTAHVRALAMTGDRASVNSQVSSSEAASSVTDITFTGDAATLPVTADPFSTTITGPSGAGISGISYDMDSSRLDGVRRVSSSNPSPSILTDLEILESVPLKNLDTGETIPLSELPTPVAEAADPLSLHIMKITKDYREDKGADSDDSYQSTATSTIQSAQQSIRKGGVKIRKILGKSMKKMKSVADDVLQKEEPAPVFEEPEEVLVEDKNILKGRASNHHKGPHTFSEVRFSQELLGEQTGPVWVMKFSPCGRLLAAGGQDSIIRVWVLRDAYAYFDDMRRKYDESKLTPGTSEESLEIPREDESTATQPAGQSTPQKSTNEQNAQGRVNLSFEEQVYEDDGDNTMATEEEESFFLNKTFMVYKGHTADVLDLSWSKNYFLLSSSMDKTVRLWHISRRECLCCFQHIDFVTAIAFHPKDDRYFLSGSLDGKARLWSIPEKKVALWNEVSAPSSLITAVNFCQSGKFAVMGTYDGRCIFFHTEQLRYFTQINVRSTRGKNARGSKITGIEPLPYEDKILVTSNDSRLRLYDLRDLTLTCKYKGFSNNSSQIKANFSHDGRFIVCGSEDQNIYIWKTYHDHSKLTARRDRNDCWESIKVRNAVVTAAIFAPKPNMFFPSQTPKSESLKSSGSSSKGSWGKATRSNSLGKGSKTNSLGKKGEALGHVILTADYTGAIQVLLKSNAITKKPAASTASSAGSTASSAGPATMSGGKRIRQ